jgi:4-hydroxyphenylpyruvate dioxygenase-like putative hemolysin
MKDPREFESTAKLPRGTIRQYTSANHIKEGKDMFKVKGIHHLGLPANDLDRAKNFYTEVLGMTCAKVDVDTETGSLYKDAMGHYPLTARLFMDNGAELVLFQRPKPLERGNF